MADYTLDDMREALTFIDAYDRDLWVGVGISIKGYFGEPGWEAWDSWSDSADSYDAAGAKSQWRTFKPGARDDVGWIYAKAKAAGWLPRQRDQSPKAKKKREKEQAQNAARRAKAVEEEEEEIARKYAVVAEHAQQLWGILKTSGPAPYLGLKKVKGYGLRFVQTGIITSINRETAECEIVAGRAEVAAFFKRPLVKEKCYSFRHLKRGTIVMPLVGEGGDIQNLQIIFEGSKCFLMHGRKKGLWHFIPGLDDSPAPPLCVAEGYATAATIHQATGWPVVVALDAGNLLPVCKSIRQLYGPDADILVCGDDDVETEGNPGRINAGLAASAVNGRVVFPEFSEPTQ